MTENANQQLAENIRWAMKKAGARSVDVANALGVSEQAVYGWRKTGHISRENLVLLARYLQISVEQIQPTADLIASNGDTVVQLAVKTSRDRATEPDDPEEMSVQEAAEKYYLASNAYPVTLDPAIRGEVPLITWQAAGRWRRGMQHNTSENRHIAVTRSVSEDAFALRVEDDTNDGRIPKGAIVVVDPQVEPKHEHFVVAQMPGSKRPTLKQLIIDGGRRCLRPANTRYPIEPLPDGTRILGVVRQAVQDFP